MKTTKTAPLKFSQRDLVICAGALSVAPWTGGEENIVARAALEEAVKPKRVASVRGTIDKCRTAPEHVVTLTPAMAELLIRLLTNPGGAINPALAPYVATCVQTIRRHHAAPPPKEPPDWAKKTP